MRIKYARLAKLFGIVVFFLIVVPYFVRDLNKSEKAYKTHDEIEQLRFKKPDEQPREEEKRQPVEADSAAEQKVEV